MPGRAGKANMSLVVPGREAETIGIFFVFFVNTTVEGFPRNQKLHH